MSKLLSDLLSYYEAHFGPEYDDSQSSDFKSYRHEKGMKSVYKKCREIIDREQASNSPFLASAEYIKQEFSSEHMDKLLIAPFLLHRSTLHCYSVPWQTAT